MARTVKRAGLNKLQPATLEAFVNGVSWPSQVFIKYFRGAHMVGRFAFGQDG